MGQLRKTTEVDIPDSVVFCSAISIRSSVVLVLFYYVLAHIRT